MHVCGHTQRHAVHSLAHLESKSATEVSVITGRWFYSIFSDTRVGFDNDSRNSVKLNFGEREREIIFSVEHPQ